MFTVCDSQYLCEHSYLDVALLNIREMSSFLKRKRDFCWLVSDGKEGAYCSCCRDYYKDRSLPKGSDGTFVT